jgi:NADP-dependent 3-hydroxy acid dehydrogenase YdfG
MANRDRTPSVVGRGAPVAFATILSHLAWDRLKPGVRRPIMELDGRTILVTGASSGIGRAIALDLAEAGARVVAVARNEDALAALAAEAPNVTASPCDLADAEARTALLDGLGPLDAVVNNAGTAWIGNLTDMGDDDVARVLTLNLEVVIAICRHVLPTMLERDDGHIVNVGSILGFAPGPPLTVYSATKAAVHAFTEGLRREVVDTGVKVSLVAPGPVKGTDALDGAGDESTTAVLQQAFDAFGTTPEEVASAVRTTLAGGGKPSTRTITVPRVAGVTRAASIPGADWALDQGFGLLRKAGVDV